MITHYITYAGVPLQERVGSNPSYAARPRVSVAAEVIAYAQGKGSQAPRVQSLRSFSWDDQPDGREALENLRLAQGCDRLKPLSVDQFTD